MKPILEKYIPIETSDGKIVLVENYNPNRDDRGRFDFGTGLTSGQALTYYQDYGYEPINNVLRVEAKRKRGEKIDEFEQRDYDQLRIDQKAYKKAKDSIKAIDKTFKKEGINGGYGHRIDNGIAFDLFQREGVDKVILNLKKEGKLPKNHADWYNSEASEQINNELSKLKGKTYKYDQFVSTSDNKESAFERFSGGGGEISEFGMESYVRIGSAEVKTLRVNDFTGMTSSDGVENIENEILFDRNSTFQINSIQMVPTTKEGYVGERGEGFGLEITLSDPVTKNKNPNHDPASGRFDFGSKSVKDYSEYTETTIHAQLTKDFSSQTSFSGQEADEIIDYSDSSYQYTNAELRENKGVVSKLGTYRKETVKTIDKAMRNKLNEDTALYRGAHISTNLSSGDTIKDYAYTSTSFRKDIAEEFVSHAAQRNTDNLYVFKILGKKNQKGIVVSMVYPGEIQRYESEFILPRNTELKVRKIKEIKDSGLVYKEVEAEIL